MAIQEILSSDYNGDAIDKINDNFTELSNQCGGGGGAIDETPHDMTTHWVHYYFNKLGEKTSTSYHSVYKYEGEGKSVRITTNSDDDVVHPICALYDADDNIVRYLIFPVPDAGTVKTYTADVYVKPGEYVLCSAFSTNVPTYTYINDISKADELKKACLEYDEALAIAMHDSIGKKIKAVMLDCGRKYFSVANIKTIIDTMSAAGLNTLELHYSESEGFRFALNDMEFNVNGVTYDLSDALGDGVADGTHTLNGSNKYLTQSDMDTIIDYAYQNGVDIVPAMDMPAHLGAILNAFPQFKYVGASASNFVINFWAKDARDFIFSVLDRYAAYFASKGCKYFNICADEISKVLTSADDWHKGIADFINDAAHVVIKNGLVPCAFNDYMCRGPRINKGIVVRFWATYGWQYYQTADVIDRNGYKMVNTNAGWYYVLGGSAPTTSGLSNSTPYTFAGNYIAPKPAGLMFCIWCDKAGTDGADDGDALTTAVTPLITAFGTAAAKGFFNGDMEFDNSTHKPKWWSGSHWYDATGTQI